MKDALERRRVHSGAPWEAQVGYCRAIRTGKHISVSGTAPVAQGGGVHAPGNAYEQAKRCLQIALAALAELGAGAADVVRTRMFVTDISQWSAFGRAHTEIFAEHPPTTTMVEVAALIDPDMLIEIEVDAICE